MKVGLVSPYDYPYPGGVTEHIRQLYHNLLEQGHEVRIIAPSSLSTRQALRYCRDFYRVGRVVSVPANGSIARITVEFYLRPRVRLILQRESFDVIHLHEPLMPSLPPTVLMDSETANVGTYHAFARRNLGYLYGRQVLARYHRKLHVALAVSPPARDFVRGYFPGEYRIIPNGVDLERFGTALPFPALRQGGVVNLVFVGRPERRKGLGYLLRAYIRLKAEGHSLRLVIVGAGRWDSYQSFVARNAIRDIVFAGRASADDLPRYMASADVICAPATGAESFGMVVVEALAAGRAMLASDIPGFRSVVQNERDALLVPPKDVEGLTNALRRLVLDEPLRRRLGETGQVTAQRYSWPGITRELVEVYLEAQDRHRAQLAEGSRPQWGNKAAWRSLATPPGRGA